MNGLAGGKEILLLLGVGLLSHHFVHNNTVVVDFSNLIEMSQIVEADLAIHRQKESVGLPANTHVNVTQTAVHVNEHDIVVEDKEVHYK